MLGEFTVIQASTVVLHTCMHAWCPPINQDTPPLQALLEPGDVLVLGSDGLWDNLWDEQVLAAVADGIKQGQVRGMDGSVQTSYWHAAVIRHNDCELVDGWTTRTNQTLERGLKRNLTVALNRSMHTCPPTSACTACSQTWQQSTHASTPHLKPFSSSLSLHLPCRPPALP